MISSCTHAVWPGFSGSGSGSALYWPGLVVCSPLLSSVRLVGLVVVVVCLLFFGAKTSATAYGTHTGRMAISLKWPFVVCKCCLLLTLLYRVPLNKYLCAGAVAVAVAGAVAGTVAVAVSDSYCIFMAQDTTFALPARQRDRQMDKPGSYCCLCCCLIKTNWLLRSLKYYGNWDPSQIANYNKQRLNASADSINELTFKLRHIKLLSCCCPLVVVAAEMFTLHLSIAPTANSRQLASQHELPGNIRLAYRLPLKFMLINALTLVSAYVNS